MYTIRYTSGGHIYSANIPERRIWRHAEMLTDGGSTVISIVRM